MPPTPRAELVERLARSMVWPDEPTFLSLDAVLRQRLAPCVADLLACSAAVRTTIDRLASEGPSVLLVETAGREDDPSRTGEDEASIDAFFPGAYVEVTGLSTPASVGDGIDTDTFSRLAGAAAGAVAQIEEGVSVLVREVRGYRTGQLRDLQAFLAALPEAVLLRLDPIATAGAAAAARSPRTSQVERALRELSDDGTAGGSPTQVSERLESLLAKLMDASRSDPGV